MLLGNIGSFMGTVEKNVNMLNVFTEDIKKKHPSWNIYKDFYRIHQLSIEAPEGTKLSINGVDMKIPSSGVLQFGYDAIVFDSIVFNEDVDVYILYIY